MRKKPVTVAALEVELPKGAGDEELAGALDPAGHTCCEARFHKVDEIVVTSFSGKELARVPTPLCPFTKDKLAAQLMNLGFRQAALLVMNGSIVTPVTMGPELALVSDAAKPT